MEKLISYKLPGNVDEVYQVEIEILKDMVGKRYDENAIFAMRLAMDEAFINAIKHGNQEDPNKFVHIEYTGSEEQVKVCVTDEGDGFDHRALNDPRSEESLKLTHGRGIFLIRQFMTSVEFNERGNCITFSLVRKHEEHVAPRGLKLWRFGDIAVVELSWELGHVENNDLEEYLRQLVESGQRRVIVDLKYLDSINTSVLSTFIIISRLMGEKKGQLKFIRLQPAVEKVINVTNLNKILDIRSDLTRAIEDMNTAWER